MTMELKRQLNSLQERSAHLLDSLKAFRRGYRYGQHVSSDFLPSAVAVSNPLERYFDLHTTGPGIWKWRHYFSAYERHLSKFRGLEAHVLEVGIYSGGSLDMWREYFGEKAQIYGADIQPSCRAYESARTQVFIGDQADPDFWQYFIRKVPRLDVVIDDGGHQTSQQIPTLEALFPHLQPGGVYICEDVHDPFNPFLSYIDGLSRGLHAVRSFEVGVDLTVDPIKFQRLVDSVHLYPFLAVIERRGATLDRLEAPKHGTEWEPFLRAPIPGGDENITPTP
jgi:hypothetical protein